MNIRQFAVAVLTLGLCGCAAPTSIKEVWKSPTYTGGPVQKIAVLAVDERELYRASVESHFVFQLNQSGQGAFVTHELLSLPAIKADRKVAAAKLRASEADALLLIRLVNSATHQSEVRATREYYTASVASYESGDWYGYYSVAFMDMGTVWGNSKQEVYLDTSLFDLKTEKRLWSGISRTVLKEDSDRIEELSALVTKVLAALRKDGLIH